MAGKKGMRDYPQEIKEKAVRMHLEEGKTHREIMIQLGINSKYTIKLWCRQHRNLVNLGVQPKPKGKARKHVLSEEEQIKGELKRLRMENELLRNFLFAEERS